MKFLRNIKNKYLELPQPLRASFWFMVMSIIQKGIQFLVTPIYTRLLTTDEYGYYSIYTSWSSILSVLATLNLGAGVFNNGMLKYKDDRKRFVSSMQGAGNIATVLVFSVVFLFHKKVTSLSGLDIYILIGMFFLMIFYPAFGYWSQYQRYMYLYKKLSCITIVSAIAIPVVSVGLIFVMPKRKYAVVAGNIIVQVLIGAYIYIYNLLKGKTLYVKEYWSFALKFNIPLIPHYLASIVLGQADRIMISRYCGQGKAGIYSLAYSVALMLNIVINAVTATYTPWTYQKMNAKQYKQIGIYSNYILILLGGIVLLGVMVAPELISFLGTPEYMEAKWIITPVMLSCFFTMVYSLFANIEFYFEKSIAVMCASVIAAAANILLNAIYIPRYGFLAAGYTTMICYLLLAVLHYCFMKKVCQKKQMPEIYDLRFIIFFSVLLTAASIILMATYNLKILRVGLVILLLLLFVVKREKMIDVFKHLKKDT